MTADKQKMGMLKGKMVTLIIGKACMEADKGLDMTNKIFMRKDKEVDSMTGKEVDSMTGKEVDSMIEKEIDTMIDKEADTMIDKEADTMTGKEADL